MGKGWGRKEWEIFRLFSYKEEIKTKTFANGIGPLHDTVTWYKITHAGEQDAQWDFQNNATRTSPPGPALFWKSHCTTNISACVILYHVTGLCQGPIIPELAFCLVVSFVFIFVETLAEIQQDSFLFTSSFLELIQGVKEVKCALHQLSFLSQSPLFIS